MGISHRFSGMYSCGPDDGESRGDDLIGIDIPILCFQSDAWRSYILLFSARDLQVSQPELAEVFQKEIHDTGSGNSAPAMCCAPLKFSQGSEN